MNLNTVNSLDRRSEDIFRSAEMSLVQFYIASEIARDVVTLFGDLGNVQFRDMNKNISTFQRSFIKEIRKYDNTQRQIRYQESTIEKLNLKLRKPNFPEVIRISPAVEYHGDNPFNSNISTSQIDDLITTISNYEATVLELDNTLDNLTETRKSLYEQRIVLNSTKKFFDVRLSMEVAGNNLPDFRNSFEFDADAEEEDLLHREMEDGLIDLPVLGNGGNINHMDRTNEVNIMGSTMNFIAGIIPSDKYYTLQKILWRVLRGNLYLNFTPIKNDELEPDLDPQTRSNLNNDPTKKYAFLIFTHGENLIKRSKKIVESLDGKIYDIDNNEEIIREQLHAINAKLNDLTQVIDLTQDRLILELKEIASSIENWKVIIKKEKSINNILNLFNYDQTRRCLIAEGWVPKEDLPLIKRSLQEVTERSQTDVSSVINELHTNRTPPTFHRTNKFTQSFQSIIDAYGIATYQEVNPGLATVVTFPFMFAIMFGDLGHGFILFLAALFLVLKEQAIGKMKNRDEIFDMAYTGRYILLLMGLFSMYTGFLYNDIFSRSMALFKSGWQWEKIEGSDKVNEYIGKQVGVYPIGLDFNWHGTDNNLLFTNSYKMKLSILMGFIHMSYSFMFSLVNYKFFRSRVDVIGNFLPGLLFMQSIFGYLSLTIVYKWCIDWIKIGKPAPGLLDMLINMFLSPGTVDTPLYKGQAFIQVVLLLIALVCIPWLLLYKPLTLRRQNNRSIALGYTDLNEHQHENNIISVASDAGSTLNGDNDDDFFTIQDFEEPEEGFNFGDVMIHQVIHTIEFCLNCVSHTASYLRLWALSLAHGQLSAVLWDMTIKNGFVSFTEKSYTGVITIYFLFGMWFVLSVCILVVMEGTSAMLHSLRLHWVEAMSKFFEGEGYAYEPFSFEKILNDADEE